MKDRKFTFDSENLAFPEIHTGKVKQNDVAEDNTDSTVVYDTVAVPEVHLKKHIIKNRRKTINKTTAVHFKSVRLKFLCLILK